MTCSREGSERQRCEPKAEIQKASMGLRRSAPRRSRYKRIGLRNVGPHKVEISQEACLVNGCEGAGARLIAAAGRGAERELGCNPLPSMTLQACSVEWSDNAIAVGRIFSCFGALESRFRVLRFVDMSELGLGGSRTTLDRRLANETKPRRLQVRQ
jgi:hypothetical protein